MHRCQKIYFYKNQLVLVMSIVTIRLDNEFSSASSPGAVLAPGSTGVNIHYGEVEKLAGWIG